MKSKLKTSRTWVFGIAFLFCLFFSLFLFIIFFFFSIFYFLPFFLHIHSFIFASHSFDWINRANKPWLTRIETHLQIKSSNRIYWAGHKSCTTFKLGNETKLFFRDMQNILVHSNLDNTKTQQRCN